MSRSDGDFAVQRMLDFIDKGYPDRITLKTVASALRANPTKLGRRFHEKVGVSVHGYVTRVRLEHAAHLIAANVKVEAVALSVGYRSKKNFYRQFSRHFGLTPEAYRRRVAARPTDNRRGTTPTRYKAQFNGTACYIDVELRANLKGRPSFVATPMVAVEHGLQPFEAPDHVEIGGDTEADALERAAVFLEHRFGVRSLGPRRYANGKPLPIVAPRP
jgi:AraC-like DNA-binding protein